MQNCSLLKLIAQLAYISTKKRNKMSAFKFRYAAPRGGRNSTRNCDAGRLFAGLEGEVREHLLRLSERPLYGGDDGSRAA